MTTTTVFRPDGTGVHGGATPESLCPHCGGVTPLLADGRFGTWTCARCRKFWPITHALVAAHHSLAFLSPDHPADRRARA